MGPILNTQSGGPASGHPLCSQIVEFRQLRKIRWLPANPSERRHEKGRLLLEPPFFVFD